MRQGTTDLSRATYYRRKAKIEKLLEDFVVYKDLGLYETLWSDSYKKSTLIQLRKYLHAYGELTLDNAKAWIAEYPPIKHASRRTRYAALVQLAKYYIHIDKWGQKELATLLAISPKKPKTYRPLVRVINRASIDELLKHIEENTHRNYDRVFMKSIVVFLSETALRASEACNLLMTDLHFSNEPTQAFLDVRFGKGGKDRRVPFSRRAQDAVRECKRALEVFVSTRGESVNEALLECVWIAWNGQHGLTQLTKNGLSHRITRLSKATNIDLCTHSLRHYRITQWANNPRIPITVTQKWAGHASLEVTQRYIHISDDEALKAAFE